MSHGAGEGEILYHADAYDHFMLSNGATDELRRDFLRYVRAAAPDVVHFHHVIGLGVEAIYAVREALPDAKIVVTFHEFLSLCHHHGQMVKKTNGALCSRSSALDCHGCFPEISPANFLRRDRFIRAMFDLCDHFVAPSRFLAERYIAWGLPRDRFSVLENGLAIEAAAPPRALPPGGRRGRFAFFGQMIENKGVDLLLEAASRVPEHIWGDDAAVMVFGGHLERTTPEYRARLETILAAAGRRARLYGPYRNSDMGAADAVGRLGRRAVGLVGKFAGRHPGGVLSRPPVIAANIGGMAEKVTDGVDGLHFRARSAEDLADRMIEGLSDPSLWARLRAGIRAAAHPPRRGRGSIWRSTATSSTGRQTPGVAVVPDFDSERRVPWPASS